MRNEKYSTGSPAGTPSTTASSAVQHKTETDIHLTMTTDSAATPPLSTVEEQVDHEDSAVVIFSTSLVKRLAQDRLPPTYVGVRRVRPLNIPVSTATTTITRKRPLPSTNGTLSSQPQHQPVVFKIVENGKERRMTSKEKKEYKRTLKQQNGKDINNDPTYKKVKMEEIQGIDYYDFDDDDDDEDDDHIHDDDKLLVEKVLEDSESAAALIPINGTQHPASTAPSNNSCDDQLVVQVQQQTTLLQEEIAETDKDTNHRHGLEPPVALSAAMARIALQQGILPSFNGDMDRLHQHSTTTTTTTTNNNTLRFDPELSNEWAHQLKDSMRAAEDVRQAENLRLMPYQIVPETWTRLRPPSLLPSTTKEEECLVSVCNDDPIQQSTVKEQILALETDAATAVATAETPSTTPSALEENPNSTNETSAAANLWSFVTIRPPLIPFDQDQQSFIEFLYYNTPFYFSCGAKFGCDFLLYDGPREERHAFAGLRILSSVASTPSYHTLLHRPATGVDNAGNNNDDLRRSTSCAWPIPSAYDLAGYVRCLNTAGKLALIATVVKTDPDAETDSHESPTRPCRVAIVDLALEKILSAPTHQRHARQNARREAGQHLAKR